MTKYVLHGISIEEYKPRDALFALAVSDDKGKLERWLHAVIEADREDDPGLPEPEPFLEYGKNWWGCEWANTWYEIVAVAEV